MRKIQHNSFWSGILVACVFAWSAGAQDRQIPALKDVFEGKFRIGAALNYAHVTGKNPQGADIVTKHFNTITSENILKWALVHPEENRYSFEAPDAYVQFGEKHGMFVVGHTLVWHNQTPDWVFRKNGRTVDRETLLARMKEHIQTVVGRYKGRVKGWDVVNEALDEDGGLRKTQWLEIIGPDYIEKAFEFAHAADPGAELYYNDYSLENAPKRRGAAKLMRELKAKGIPVVAVGLQGHYKMDWPSPKELHQTIDTFADLGLKCMITELDVDVLPSRRGGEAEITAREQGSSQSNPYAFGLPERVDRALARRYAELFKVFLKNEEQITRVTFWGVTDADSWLNNWPVRGRVNHPLLFDRKGEPKKAFWEVVDTAPRRE